MPTIDRATLYTQFPEAASGDTTILTEMIALYLEDIPKGLDKLAAALEVGDAVRVQRAAHTLKGASRSLDAAALAAQCEALEAEARSGVPQGAAQRLDALRAEFDRSAAELRQIVGGPVP